MKAKESDLLDAIQHADIGDEGWTLDDFQVLDMKDVELSRIRKFEDWGGWIDVDPKDFEGMSPDERIDELASFRGPAWAERARGWLKTGVPPIVVIDAPVVVDYELHRQVGDGRGRINLALAMGLKSLPVTLMKWRHPLAESRRPNPEDSSMKLRRISPGFYESTDGLWQVWRLESGEWTWGSTGLRAGGDDVYSSKKAAISDLVYFVEHPEEFARANPSSPQRNPMGSPNYTDMVVPAEGITNVRTVAKLFLEAASICWGEQAQAYLLKKDGILSSGYPEGRQRLIVEQVEGRRDTGTLAALIVDRKPVYKRGYLTFAPHYTLQVGTALYSEPVEEACRVIMHEAIHIAIFNHGEDFRRVADRVGAPYSETALRRGSDAEPVFVVQRRLPSERRYANWVECKTMREAKTLAARDQTERRVAQLPECSYRVTY